MLKTVPTKGKKGLSKKKKQIENKKKKGLI